MCNNIYNINLRKEINYSMKKKLLIASSLLFLFLSGCNGIGGGNNSSQGDLSINTSNNNVTSENGNPTSEGDKTSSENATPTLRYPLYFSK